MRRSKIAQEKVIPNFAKWTEAYINPLSVARVLTNALYEQIDYLYDSYEKLVNSHFLDLLNPLEEPYRNWVTLASDIIIPPEASGEITGDDVLSNLGNLTFYGVISGEEIPLNTTTSVRSYLYSIPDGYYSVYRIPVQGTNNDVPYVVDASGNTHTYCELAERASVVSNTVYIMLDSITSGTPNHIELTFDDKYLHGEMEEPIIVSGESYIDISGEILTDEFNHKETEIVSGDYFTFVERDDPLILNGYETFTVKTKGTKVLLQKFAIGDISVTDEYGINKDIYYTIDSTKGKYTTDNYKEEYDFNKDGLIDDDDYFALQSNIGKSRADYPIDEWNEKYAMYDLDKDGEITENDLRILDYSLNSARNEGTIVIFETPGIFSISYKYTANGGTSFIFDDGGIAYLDTRVYNNIQPTKSEFWVSAAYSDLLKSYLYLDNMQNRVVAVKYADDIPGMVIDTLTILLPITNPNEIPVSIDVYKNNLYVLVKGGEHPYFIVYDLTSNVHDNYVIQHIHKRKRPDSEIVDRNKDGLVDPIGFEVISDDIIIAIDKTGNGYINMVLLRGLHDNIMYDIKQPENLPGLFTREQYDELIAYDGNYTYKLKQYYFHIWNKFDDFAFENGLERLPGENNTKLRMRLHDYFENYPGPDKESIEKEIKREFML